MKLENPGRALVALAVTLAATCLGAAEAEAAQTVEVTMNGHRHAVAIPDGWRAAPEDGGVFIQPPAGRNEGLQVVVVGVPKPANSVTAIQMAKNIADSDKKKKTYLSATEADAINFVGVEGAIITLDGVDPSGKRETIVYVMAMNGDTTYLLQASGTYDDLVANLEDIRFIVQGVQLLGGAPAAVPRKDAPPPPPSEPLWTKDTPLSLPAAGAKHLVNDAMLGVRVARLDGWGVSAGMNAYAIENRMGDKARVVASIWLGTDKFTGSGNEYMKKVAGEANAHWDRFGGQDALMIERPPQFAGAGDVLEIHVLRGETPIVFSLRFDGGKWKDREGKEMLAELDGATKVTDPGKAKGVVAIGGGVTKIKPGKGWTFETYGPGAMAVWKKGSFRARIAVFSRGTVPPLQCDADQSRPPAQTTRLAGKDASSYSCPNDPAEQVFYTVGIGDYVVYLGFTDTGAGKAAGRAAAEFAKFVKF